MLPDTVRRWLYSHRHASGLARLLNAAQARLAAAGAGPRWLVTVEVTGRRTGRTISFPAVIADYDNGRYLVSMLGEDTNWVRNVRASGGRAVLRHGGREPVMLREVEVDQPRSDPALLSPARTGGQSAHSGRSPGAGRGVRADRSAIPGVPGNGGEAGARQ